jgi:hypothetical protein
MNKFSAVFIALLGATCAVAACSDDDDDDTTAEGGSGNEAGSPATAGQPSDAEAGQPNGEAGSPAQGGAAGDGECLKCSVLISAETLPSPDELCEASAVLLNEVLTCGCAEDTCLEDCAGPCSGTMGEGVDTCRACLGTSADCMTPVLACAGDV